MSEWLTGNTFGFRGPWGTVYPINLRLFVHSVSRSQFTSLFLNAPRLPVMPFEDYGHGHVSAADLGAVYDFIYSLGKAGSAAPINLPPGQRPKTKVIDFVPH